MVLPRPWLILEDRVQNFMNVLHGIPAILTNPGLKALLCAVPAAHVVVRLALVARLATLVQY